MSSHNTQKFFNLHHDQVNAGRARRLQCQANRLQCFLNDRAEARFDYKCMLGFSFICFAYTMIATAAYLGYIL